MLLASRPSETKQRTVVATGGVALFHGATKAIDHFDPDPTFVVEVYRRNAVTVHQVHGLTGDHHIPNFSNRFYVALRDAAMTTPDLEALYDVSSSLTA